MADERGTLDRLAEGIGRAFSAFEALFAPDNLPTLFLELGLDQSISVGSDAAFLQKVADAGTQAAALANAVDDLVAAVEADDTALLIEQVTKVVEAIGRLAKDLDAIATDLNRVASGSPDAAAIGEFALEFAERALGDALLRYLDAWHPAVAAALCLLGLAEETPIDVNLPPVDPHFQGDDTPPLFLRRQLHLDRLAQLFQDPLAVFQTTYGWGSEAFDGRILFRRIAAFFAEVGPLATVEEGLTDFGAVNSDLPEDSPPLPPVLELFSVSFLPTTDAHPPGIDGTLHVDVGEQSDITLGTFGDDFRVALQIAGALVAGLRARLLPPANLTVTSEAKVEGDAALALIGAASDPTLPFLVFGETGGSRLQTKGFRAGIRSGLQWDAVNERALAEVVFEVKVSEGKLVVDTSKSDGFLQRLLPSDGLNVDFDFDLGWSARRGFFFSGSAGLELAFALNLTEGPFHLDTVHLVIGAAPDKLRLEASLDGGGTLGPIATSIERIGVNLDFRFSRGNLGPVDLDVGFKSPSGVGLSIDAAALSGGGFLKHDPSKSEYGGVLQLQYVNLALQAFGLITTQVVGGEGYSLLALVDAEFPPIQLGWGFTLNGVGGLLAVHRTASTDALHAALKAGQLSSILFPKSAISNAPAILGQLDAMFPTAPGRFLFGPMALIGWGTPPKLKASIAVVVELPEPVRVILLSRIEARLPNELNPVVRVNMDALGVLDLGKDELSFDAILFDSKIIDYTLSGTMALRAAWGSPDHREFVLAIGGVHPRFTPPPDFPQLQRITINMPSGSISKLRLAAYMAVTANAVQFGANLDVSLGASGFGVSGHLGFDALLQIIPFRFDSDISGKFAITADGDDIASVDLEGTLSGPKPYHIAGQFKVHIVFFDVGVSFDYSWGGDLLDLLAPAIDVANLLETALADVRNWDAQLPVGISPLVTVRQIDNSTILLAHPLARPGVHQSVVPLGLTITRFGEGVPSGDNTFTITGLRMGTGTIPHDATQDDFAPAQFFELTDDEKLERPSFERHDAGLRVQASDVTSGAPVPKTAAYESFYVDTPGGPLREDPGVPLTPPGLGDLSVVLQFGSAGRAATRNNRGRYRVPGNPIRVAEPAFVLADKTTMAAAGIGPAAGATFSEMHALLAGNRALQILGAHEMTVN